MLIMVMVSQLSFFFGGGSCISFGDIDPFVLGVFLEPGDNAISITSSVVLDGLSGLVLAPELESGISLDVQTGNFVLSQVNFSQHNVGVVGESLGGLVVVGSQVLAVAAPRGVELDQDFLGGVEDDFLEGAADDDLNGLIVGFGDGGGFEERLNFSTVDLGDESGEGLSGDCIAFEPVFFAAVLEQQHGGGVLGVDSEVFGEFVEESVSVVFAGDGEDEVGRGLIIGFEGFMGVGLCGLVAEEEEERGGLLLSEDGING